jgi:hypothetical protein
VVKVPEELKILTHIDTNVRRETRPGMDRRSAEAETSAVGFFVADHHSFYHEHNILSDIGCQISAAREFGIRFI